MGIICVILLTIALVAVMISEEGKIQDEDSPLFQRNSDSDFEF